MLLHQISPSFPGRDMVEVCQGGSSQFMLCSSSQLPFSSITDQGYWASPNICLHTSPSSPGSCPTFSVFHPNMMFTFLFLALNPKFWLQSASQPVDLSPILLLIGVFRTCHYCLVQLLSKCTASLWLVLQRIGQSSSLFAAHTKFSAIWQHWKFKMDVFACLQPQY